MKSYIPSSPSFTLYAAVVEPGLRTHPMMDLDWLDKLSAQMDPMRFVPLTAESEDKDSAGWVTPGDLTKTDFSRTKCSFDAYWLLSLRHDTWKFPRELFRATYEDRMQEFRREFQRPALTRAEKKAIKESVEGDFRHQTLPTAREYRAVWNLQTHDVFFFSTGKSANEMFVSFFDETFDCQLELMSAPARAYAQVGDMQFDALDINAI